MDVLHALHKLPGLDVMSDEASLVAASTDASLFTLRPQAVVAPHDSAALQRLVTWVAQQPPGTVSLTPRAAGTDMSGGPLSASLVVDMARHFNHILAVGSASAVTQPGVYYRDFEAATLKQGWLMPAYPASRELCTIGGMVANNAGGEKSLQYGKTDRYVTSLKAVLADGHEYTVAPLQAEEVTAKMKQRDFEGELYYRVATLIDKNEQLVADSRPKVSKNSAGYNIWEVWDGHRFDLTKLLIGSQGTLGILTEVTFRLIEPKPQRQLLVLFLHDVDQLAHIVPTILRYEPEAFESYDHHTLRLALQSLPGLLRQLSSTNPVALLRSFWPEIRSLLRGRLPQLVLLAEFSGYSQREVTLRAQAAAAAVESLVAGARLVTSPLEAQKYWTIRRESFNVLRRHNHHEQTAPFIDDIVVRPSDLPSFFPRLQRLMDEYKLTFTIAGHMGDGNFHIIPLLNLRDKAALTVIEELSTKVFALVKEYQGSMSGEHNDGLIRGHFLSQMYGAEVYQLFAGIKEIFDPQNIFNPGKKTGTRWEDSRKLIALR